MLCAWLKQLKLGLRAGMSERAVVDCNWVA
jgi:hypothetical protein